MVAVHDNVNFKGDTDGAACDATGAMCNSNGIFGDVLGNTGDTTGLMCYIVPPTARNQSRLCILDINTNHEKPNPYIVLYPVNL